MAGDGGGDAIVVKQSSAFRDGLFGVLDVVFILIVVRALTGSGATSGKVVLVVLFGLLFVGCTVVWVLVRRHPSHLEISADRIRYVTGKGDEPDIVRANGDELEFATEVASGGRSSMLTLRQTATSVTWQLPLFRVNPISAALGQRQWRVTSRVGSTDK